MLVFTFVFDLCAASMFEFIAVCFIRPVSLSRVLVGFVVARDLVLDSVF